MRWRASVCKDSVAAANATTRSFEQAVQPNALLRLQEVEESRLDAVSHAIAEFGAVLRSTGALAPSAADRIHEAALRTSVPTDICSFAATFAIFPLASRS